MLSCWNTPTHSGASGSEVILPPPQSSMDFANAVQSRGLYPSDVVADWLSNDLLRKEADDLDSLPPSRKRRRNTPLTGDTENAPSLQEPRPPTVTTPPARSSLRIRRLSSDSSASRVHVVRRYGRQAARSHGRREEAAPQTDQSAAQASQQQHPQAEPYYYPSGLAGGNMFPEPHPHYAQHVQSHPAYQGFTPYTTPVQHATALSSGARTWTNSMVPYPLSLGHWSFVSPPPTNAYMPSPVVPCANQRPSPLPQHSTPMMPPQMGMPPFQHRARQQTVIQGRMMGPAMAQHTQDPRSGARVVSQPRRRYNVSDLQSAPPTSAGQTAANQTAARFANSANQNAPGWFPGVGRLPVSGMTPNQAANFAAPQQPDFNLLLQFLTMIHPQEQLYLAGAAVNAPGNGTNQAGAHAGPHGNTTTPPLTPHHLAMAGAASGTNMETLLHLAAQLENRRRGLNREELDNLPTWRFKARGEGSSPSSLPEQTRCMVCLEDFEAKQTIRALFCRHEFHSKCVDKWLKNNRTCPMCRADAHDGTHQDEYF